MARTTIEELIAKREAVNARIRREQAKARTQERKDDTRRKVLAGAAVLERAAKDDLFKHELHQQLAGFLTRPDDRALFGLAPLPATPDAKPEAAEAAENRAA